MKNKIKVGMVLKGKDNSLYDIEIVKVIENGVIVYRKETTGNAGFENFDYIENNFILPEEKWCPESKRTYFVPEIEGNGYSSCTRIFENTFEFHLENNLVCQTKEEAIAKAEHMIKSLETFKK